MPSFICSKNTYNRLSGLAVRLKAGQMEGVPENIVWMYVNDIIQQIQQAPLPLEITEQAKNEVFKQQIFKDLVDFMVQKLQSKFSTTSNLNTPEAVAELVQTDPKAALYSWQSIVYGYLQKSRSLGLNPDESHLLFFKFDKNNQNKESSYKKIPKNKSSKYKLKPTKKIKLRS